MADARPATRETPLVSVVCSTYQYGRFLAGALDSALSQTDPGGPVEVIVVDDGSTDETPAVLARYGDRIRALRQANAGQTAGVERGLRTAAGQFISLLDSDDEWPRDRLARHVAILRANPTLGLVHGDMELIDVHGQVTDRSFMARQPLPPVDGRALGPLLSRNFVSGGATTFRASLLPAVLPMGEAAVYHDWRIAAGVAAVAEIAFDPMSANRYRAHGANRGLGADGAKQLQIERGELPWRRWMMANLAADDTVGLDHLRAVLDAWRFGITAAAYGAATSARELLAADPSLRRPAAPRASRALLAELAADPFDGATLVDLEIALLREAALPSVPPAPPLIGLETRGHTTLAGLEEVLARPQLLEGWARESAGADASLVVLVPPGADLGPLAAIVAASPRLADEACDIQAVASPLTAPAASLLVARAHARLTDGPADGAWAALASHPGCERAAAVLAA